MDEPSPKGGAGSEALLGRGEVSRSVLLRAAIVHIERVSARPSSLGLSRNVRYFDAHRKGGDAPVFADAAALTD